MILTCAVCGNHPSICVCDPCPDCHNKPMVCVCTQPKVVNCKKENYHVYIGRGSKFGNPYSHQEGTQALWVVDTREDAIRLYEEWLRAQPELMAAVKKELRGKILGCFCSPLACHGDVLLKIANEENEEVVDAER